MRISVYMAACAGLAAILWLSVHSGCGTTAGNGGPDSRPPDGRLAVDSDSAAPIDARIRGDASTYQCTISSSSLPVAPTAHTVNVLWERALGEPCSRPLGCPVGAFDAFRDEAGVALFGLLSYMRTDADGRFASSKDYPSGMGAQWVSQGPGGYGAITFGADAALWFCRFGMDANVDPRCMQLQDQQHQTFGSTAVAWDAEAGLYRALGGGYNGTAAEATFGPDGALVGQRAFSYSDACGYFWATGSSLFPLTCGQRTESSCSTLILHRHPGDLAEPADLTLDMLPIDFWGGLMIATTSPDRLAIFMEGTCYQDVSGRQCTGPTPGDTQVDISTLTIVPGAGPPIVAGRQVGIPSIAHHDLIWDGNRFVLVTASPMDMTLDAFDPQGDHVVGNKLLPLAYSLPGAALADAVPQLVPLAPNDYLVIYGVFLGGAPVTHVAHVTVQDP